MNHLQDALTLAVNEKRLHGLTLWRVSTGWQANVQREDGNSGWKCCTHESPVAALLEALSSTDAQPAPRDDKPGLFD